VRTFAQLLVSALSALAMLCVAAGPSLSAPCASSCACDDDAAEHADHEGGDDCGDEHEGEHEDECPDDCPGCACGGGASAASTPLAMVGGPVGESAAVVARPVESRASGVSSAVFRPPRV
jgi:hypothetical protein